MRVLMIGYVWPEPNSSAAGWRSLAVIESLQQMGAEVVFGCAAASSDQAVDLSELGVKAVPITLNCSSFDQLVAELKPALVVFDRFVCEEQFGWRVAKACPQALRILDTQDLHCLREARQQWVKQAQGRGDANGVAASELDLHSELALRELASIWRSDLSLVISEAEIELLIEQFGVDAALLQYFPLLLESTDKVSKGYGQRRHFITLGNFRHAPNWDSLNYLRSEIWPLIRRQLPGVECHIYGAYPPPKAQQLHSDKLGFLLRGWARDSGQVLAGSRILLAPLRFGAGQKGKLLEAMSQGTPSVTTPIGAESMAGPMPWPGEVAQGAAALAEAAVGLYRDPQRWQQAQQQGLALLALRFNREAHSRALQQRLRSLQANLEAHRRGNFIGQMLGHHSLQAQRYMSQWIEAKNRTAEQSDKSVS